MLGKGTLFVGDTVRDKKTDKVYEVTSLAPTKPGFIRARRIRPPRNRSSSTYPDVGNYFNISRLEHAIAPELREMEANREL